ncbi:hypothetical protein FACS1894208_09470 [Clostridia bacterium]|nr:hypothetical protein FACS1894208_09470 [Clostridia bacterium]
MEEITYTMVGDYLLPDIGLSEEPEELLEPIGKYGAMRRAFLKEHRAAEFSGLVLSEELFPHLRQVERTANERLERLIPQLALEKGVTEAMKAEDPLKWAAAMNALKAQAEQLVVNEIIYE